MRTTGRLLALSCLLVSIAFAVPQADQVALRILVSGTEEEARQYRSQLEAGQSFDTLAREASLDPSAAAGGYLGLFAIADLRVEFQNAVRELDPGAISQAFQLGSDYALLQILTPIEEAWMSERNAGMEDVGQRRYVEAMARFEAALEHAGQFGPRDQRLATSLNDLAEVHRIRGDGARAIPLYRRALAIWEGDLETDHPDIATTLNNLAEAYRSEGDYPAAESLYRRAMAIWEQSLGPDHPNVATGLNNLGMALHAEGRLEEAETGFRRALAIWEESPGPSSPSVAAVLNNLANVLRTRGSYSDAETLVRRSLMILEEMLGPNHPELIGNLDSLGQVASSQEDYAEAAAQFTRSLEIRWGPGGSPGEVTAVLEDLMDLVARGLVRDEGFDGAFSAFVENTHGFAPDPDVHVAIGGILLSAGLGPEGETILARAAGRFPGAWNVHFRLGEFYADSGRYQMALAELRTALESADSATDRYRIFVRIGDVHRELEQLDASLSAFEDARDLTTGDATAAIGMGLVYTRQERLTDALAQFERAVLTDPASQEGHYRLADLYLRLERFDEAAATAERAVSLEPTHRRAHYLLGRALMRIERPNDGQRALVEYARLESDERAREARVLESIRIETNSLEALTTDDADLALALLQDGIDAYPEAVRLRLALGLVQIRLGQNAAAIRTLGAIVDEGLGDDSVVHRSLAIAYAMLGETVPSGRHTALSLQRIRTELEAQLPR